ncbi:MAG: YqaJ viral recombinase family protein [Gammaproteobacteria bacterium]|nr:YqaJ viral recombinase family protein [Gammaproteobacteria bacterium]MBU1655185.1 YqaJ viral recombinase family protein [Gammaproteobacteria bacterium]MBU1959996.1 YqaJ viral recombinase family protein [Gammaproteobacteria bacterium]
MNVVNIAQRTPEWYPWRKQGVTGTDAAAILGRHDEKTPWRIWAEKLDKVPPVDLSGNPNVRRGVELEPVARKHIEEKYGLMLLPFCGEHDEHPILRVSFDGVDDNGRPVEIKCPADSTFESVKESGTESKEYKRYYVQVQHQILVAGSDGGKLVFFRFNPQTGEPETVEFDIQKDEALHQEIITESLAFWDLVLNEKEPAKDPLLDIFVPAGQERGEWMTLAAERKRVSAFLAAAEGQVKTLKGQQKGFDDKLVLLMGEFLRAECDGVAITRYQQQASVDWKALIAELAPQLVLTDDVLDKYRGAVSSRMRVTQADTEEAEKKASKKRKEKKDAEPEPTQPEQEEPRSSYAW